LRILNIVDDVTRECLAAIPDTSISGKRAARELTMLIERRGKPRMIVSDNGTEFTSKAVLHWSKSIESSGTTSHPATDAERLHRIIQRQGLHGLATEQALKFAYPLLEPANL
jgi:transposase InsO family protein